ncbi:MAG: ABC transporter permease subunit [Acidimicrobiales bacterium]
MIWLTWRAHRAVLAVSSAVVLACMAWMLVVQHDYSGAAHAIVRSCSQGRLDSENSVCNALYATQASTWEQADVIRGLLLGLPLLFGALLGAPLFAGELERKTVLLAFTQGISRTRWMVIRWLVIALAVLALASVVTILTNWWFGQVPINGPTLISRIQPGGFDATGIVPVAYALFAFALGAALGMVLRRTARAIFGTVVLFVTTRLLFEHYVRPHLVAPRFAPEAANGGIALSSGPLDSNWIFGSGYRVAPGSGHPSSRAYLNHILERCGQPYGPNWGSCLTQHGVQLGTFFQPASRYWALRWGEAAAFSAAAVALFGLALWSVRRWRA